MLQASWCSTNVASMQLDPGRQFPHKILILNSSFQFGYPEMIGIASEYGKLSPEIVIYIQNYLVCIKILNNFFAIK